MHSNISQPENVSECGDLHYEHTTSPCEASSCRKSVCHSEKDKCWDSGPFCCECTHGRVFNGSACVMPDKDCMCRDEKDTLRRPGEMWVDANDVCLEHMCSNNAIDTKDRKTECISAPCNYLVRNIAVYYYYWILI